MAMMALTVPKVFSRLDIGGLSAKSINGILFWIDWNNETQFLILQAYSLLTACLNSLIS